MVYSEEDLIQLQSLPLERKIQITQAKIIEYYERLNGLVYVSFSGGKDSTVLLHIARKIYPDIPGVFINTGLEYPEIKKFVEQQDNIVWVHPERFNKDKGKLEKYLFSDVIKNEGYPVVSKEISLTVKYARKGSKWALERLNGERKNYKYNAGWDKYHFLIDAPFKISDGCCDIMKKDPAKRYEKLTKRSPIIGTMASEGGQRKSGYKQTGCNSFNKKRNKSVPLGFWTEQDILQYIKKYDLPISEIYGEVIESDVGLKNTGLQRTGCMFCPFGAHLDKGENRFQRLKITHPKQYEYIMKPTNEGGLGFKQILDYLGIKYE